MECDYYKQRKESQNARYRIWISTEDRVRWIYIQLHPEHPLPSPRVHEHSGRRWRIPYHVVAIVTSVKGITIKRKKNEKLACSWASNLSSGGLVSVGTGGAPMPSPPHPPAAAAPCPIALVAANICCNWCICCICCTIEGLKPKGFRGGGDPAEGAVVDEGVAPGVVVEGLEGLAGLAGLALGVPGAGNPACGAPKGIPNPAPAPP